jgi:hypothetical protein
MSEAKSTKAAHTPGPALAGWLGLMAVVIGLVN